MIAWDGFGRVEESKNYRSSLRNPMLLLCDLFQSHFAFAHHFHDTYAVVAAAAFEQQVTPIHDPARLPEQRHFVERVCSFRTALVPYLAGHPWYWFWGY